MKPYRQIFVAITLVCALWTVQTASAQIISQQDQPLKSADGSTHIVTTGRIRVPDLHAEAATLSNTIELAFIRVRQSDRPGLSAHIVLAGGPGDSGVSLVCNMVLQGGAGLLDLFDGDIIGIDQRGTGASLPNLSVQTSYQLPLDQPGSLALWLPLMEQTSSKVAAEFRSRGIRLEAYNTLESAGDVNDVRLALGYEKLSLWGRSYGTHLALAVLKQYPEKIDRMILVGPEGPDQTWKLPSQADAVIQRISEQSNEPDLLRRMQSVIDRLKKTPVTVNVVDPATQRSIAISIGAFDVQWLTVQALDNPRTIATLPAAYRKMEKGDFQSIAQLALMFRKRLGVESAMKHMMDGSSGASTHRRQQIESQAATATLGNILNFPGMYLSKAWGAQDLGDFFREPVSSKVPTLILAGELDPRTPVANGQQIANTLPNARVIVVKNASHQFDVFGSADIRSLLARFLRNEPITEESITLQPIVFQ
ncbi:MAG TPA: alpha/beta fold hydrolase [Arenimonas sp.]|nr:alpha/beta fold hydrolase [Arenimonas sp.]